MSLTSIAGIKVGHWQDEAALTGCTVILCPEEGCIASGSSRGGAPGSRETALLSPEKSVERIHALVLSGGSAFGLATADGVVRYLREQGVGLETPHLRVPIVPAAIIYDYWPAEPAQRDVTVAPDAQSGYLAAQAASDAPVVSGRLGAGMGANCGKYLGLPNSSQFGGLGSAQTSIRGVTIAAMSINNALGDIIDPDTGEVLSGAILPNGSRPRGKAEAFSRWDAGTNTTLIAITTDATLNKTEAYVLAESAHAGLARAIRPSHTPGDGDSSFVISTCQQEPIPLTLLAAAVQEVVVEAILNGARAANS